MAEDQNIRRNDTAQMPEGIRTPPGGEKKRKKLSPKARRILKNSIAAVIALAVLGAVIWGSVLFFTSSSEEEGEVIDATVTSGSITSTVSSEALTRAKDSSSLTLTTSGTVQEIFVKEGDKVEAGQKLYRIKSEAAEEAVASAQKEVENYTRELKKLQAAQADLTIRAPHSGKLQEVAAPKVGETAESGTVVAKLVDDSQLSLRQYYSYAYASDIKAGQSADISIPALMSTVKGTVSAVHMVERISPEGSKLFEVDFTLKNPGTLTEGMAAGATLKKGSETIYPYEDGKLAFVRTTEIAVKTAGPVEKVNLRDYAKVKSGEVLLVLGKDESDSSIFTMSNQLKEAQKALDEAKHTMNLLSASAPIAGTVMSVGMEPGAEVASGTTVMVISDTSSIVLDAKVDERNISRVEEGMSVDIDQWGITTTGTVTSVSLTSTAENGVATFPVTITVDNSDGILTPGSYASYSMITSRSENCLVLPIQAVKSVETEEGTQTVVFVRSDTEPKGAITIDVPVEGVPEEGYWAVPVTTGINDNENIEILEGVEEGMQVFQQVLYNDAMM